jgi:hypothetical protein
MRVVLAFLMISPLSLQAACQSSGFEGLTGKKDNSGNGTQSDTDTEEDDSGNEPAEVAGAFLCGPAGDYAAPDGEVSYGCAVRRKDSDEKFSGEATEPRARLTVAGVAAVELPTFVAPETSNWHFFFTVASATVTKQLSLDASVRINGAPFAATLSSLSGQFDIQIAVDTDGQICDCPLDPWAGASNTTTETATGTDTDTIFVPPAPDRILFVTAEYYTPGHATLSRRFLGAAGAGSADDVCEQAAADSTLAVVSGKTFKAFIGSADRDLVTMLNDGAMVRNSSGSALGRADFLLSGGIKELILTENGAELGASERAWTGLDAQGAMSTLTCDAWSDNDDKVTGDVGIPSKIGGTWFHDLAPLPCDGGANPPHLYCISQ